MTEGGVSPKSENTPVNFGKPYMVRLADDLIEVNDPTVKRCHCRLGTVVDPQLTQNVIDVDLYRTDRNCQRFGNFTVA